MNAAITCEDVRVSYGDLQVLRGVSFDIPAGQGVVLLGANGCGKSTLLRSLNGLEKLQSGRVMIHGASLTDASRRDLRKIRRSMGYVFQQFNLVPQLSAFQNVLLGAMGRHRLGLLSCLGLTASAEERARAMACLDRVGMADRAQHRPSQLSGGQQQRVAIARMLMQAPKVVIADEPIASLDPKAGREVLDLLWRIVREEGLSMLCTLHQLELAQEYADRIIGMKAGQVEIDSAIAETDSAQMNALYSGMTRVDAIAGGTAA
ncbi:MAG: phosphonate transport system ATP-binding protein [Roseibaca calidilacus]|uniref:Phosphonate transport system ATP-binding protein n=1 Tax=Roseibaca calidilacus TaxID=1666912 RepID=A0A0P7Z1I1_9RHOB|nr:phosphonate ABC transporter ATP-binding protein [Roseibaca calidilacus]KPP95519.1 MAG: phosphonate transport system ATP-binding protein [Roseibaca calidilacus]CUX82157.1 phosphonate transport system ATP-binding protein [Roseibaca calidilacus]